MIAHRVDFSGCVQTDVRPQLEEVLYWVNSVRDEHFHFPPLTRLPRGMPGDGGRCVIHNCFWAPGEGGSAGTYYLKGRELRDGFIAVPPVVGVFIRDFDAGLYPELEANNV